jgi:adenylate kinase family enzyme
MSKGIYAAVDGNGSLEQVFERIKNVLPENLNK